MNKVSYITKTAVLIALLIVFQLVTKPMGQYVTGSLVNMVLLVAVFAVGLPSGLTVAVISPFLAFIMGIGTPIIQIVPIIALGNAVIVLIVYLIAKPKNGLKTVKSIIAVVVGAISKTAFLYFGIVFIALPLVPGLKDPQIKALSLAFSYPQLITGIVGGLLAFSLSKVLVKALGSSK